MEGGGRQRAAIGGGDHKTKNCKRTARSKSHDTQERNKQKHRKQHKKKTQKAAEREREAKGRETRRAAGGKTTYPKFSLTASWLSSLVEVPSISYQLLLLFRRPAD